jgi:dihydrofolate reductase
MPAPLKNRTNILITKKNKSNYPGADKYISGDIVNKIINLEKNYINKDIFVIGGPEIINQCFDLFKEFYLTRIYGDFNCEKFIDLNQIKKKMKLRKKINSDETCHFEIWKK